MQFLYSKEKDSNALQQYVDEQASEIASLQRKVRELEARIEELEEDLESERNAKSRVSAQEITSHFIGYDAYF